MLNQPAWRAEMMVSDLGERWRIPETHGAEHDRWTREQFAAITADPAAPSPREPWRANRHRAKNKRRR